MVILKTLVILFRRLEKNTQKKLFSGEKNWGHFSARRRRKKIGYFSLIRYSSTDPLGQTRYSSTHPLGQFGVLGYSSLWDQSCWANGYARGYGVLMYSSYFPKSGYARGYGVLMYSSYFPKSGYAVYHV